MDSRLKPSSGTIEAMQSSTSGSRMMSDLARLAQWTKLAGSTGEMDSLAFVRSQMDEAGYDTKILLHDAFISLPGKASLSIGSRNMRCITQSMAVSTPEGGVTADVIDAGAGTPADFDRIDAAGKIILVDGIASPGVAVRASAARVAGVIHTSPHEHIHEMCISPVWGNPSSETRQKLPTCPVVTICEAEGNEIRDMLGTAPVSATIDAEVDTGWRKTPLLVAELGVENGDDEPFVLFSGHHDTWYFGVMDNGSANVSILEVARLCAERRNEWKRGLRICFWSGHSQGRYSGSAWYADEHFEELERRCVAHVNIDSPGGKGAMILRNAGVMSELRPLAAAAIRAATGEELVGKRKVRSADESFPGVGIPSMFGSLSGQESAHPKMRNSLGWWWHTPDDLYDKLDEANLVRDTNVLIDVVWHLLNDEILPLDQASKVGELLEQLENLHKALGDTLPLLPLIEAVAALKTDVTRLLSGQEDLPADVINTASMKLSRILVPLDYTRGNRFAHDAALPISAWPMLDPIRKLAECEAGTDEFLFAKVSARQTLNQIAHHIREAAALVTAALGSADTQSVKIHKKGK